MTQQLAGPEGPLEYLLDQPLQATMTPGIWILCHPHPLYGGSLHDAVLASASAVLTAAGHSVIRFNFRGVGSSSGRHAQGIGERDDLLAVARFARETYPDQPLAVGGYSFGAQVVWHSLPALPDAAACWLIAPPTAAMPFTSHLPGVPVAAVYGSKDDYVDPAQLETLPIDRREVLPGADHFFAGEHPALQDCLRRLLA